MPWSTRLPESDATYHNCANALLPINADIHWITTDSEAHSLAE